MENIEVSIIEQMVKENPNDYDLGGKIRQMILEIKRKQNGIQQEVSK